MSLDNELDALLMNEPGAPVIVPSPALVIRPPEFVPAAHPQWDRCKGWIEAALEHDPLTPADVENQIRAGNAILWPGKACSIVTEVVTYPNGQKVIQPIAAGGDLAEIESFIPGIEACGRAMGCTLARIEGRMGWQKRMKAFGYAYHSVILTKVI
jgi:hypothetical protein